jgi:mRNA-degrading endonuclease RelE of RelBE toxin-antitoxin system
MSKKLENALKDLNEEDRQKILKFIKEGLYTEEEIIARFTQARYSKMVYLD